MKQIIRMLVLLCFVLTVSAEGAAYSEAEASMLEAVRQSVVHVYAVGYGEDGVPQTRWTGTAFAVGLAGEETDVFLTNWHVVSDSGRFAPERVRLWILKDDASILPTGEPWENAGYECRVLATTDGYPDVAVIQTVSPVAGYRALPLLSSRRVFDGTPVYALGFPGLAATRYGADSGPEDIVVSVGAVSDHLIMTQAGYSWAVIHTAPIQHGNSGGPLVNAEGAVVALNTYGFEESVTTEFFCSVYTDYAMELLDGLGIGYTAADGPSVIHVFVADLVHFPGLPGWAAYVLFALGVLLIAAFFISFLKACRETVQEIKERLRKRAAEGNETS